MLVLVHAPVRVTRVRPRASTWSVVVQESLARQEDRHPPHGTYLAEHDARRGQEAVARCWVLDVAGDAGAADAPVASDQEAGGCRPDEARDRRCSTRCTNSGRGRREAVDPAGAAAQVDAADGAVHGAQRAAVLRAAQGLQPALPVVSTWTWSRRASCRHLSATTATGSSLGPTTCPVRAYPAEPSSRRRSQGEADERRPLHRGRHAGCAWASLKSFKKKDDDQEPPDDPGNPTVDFHGEKRTNETHESTRPS